MLDEYLANLSKGRLQIDEGFLVQRKRVRKIESGREREGESVCVEETETDRKRESIYYI